jgi:hypothetical protein
MRVFISVLFFLSFCTFAVGQTISKADSLRIVNKFDDSNSWWKIKDYKVLGVDSETENQGITIQNSFPKGDGYTDSSGKIFGITLFWTRIINQTANLLELTFNFPSDSLIVKSSPDSYLKLFLPPDTMTLDKVSLYGYGITDLKSTLDTGLNNPSVLQRTINAKEDFIFYVGVLSDQVPDKKSSGHQTGVHQEAGVIRTALVLKDSDFYYRIGIDLDSIFIPCGQIVFKR